MPSCSDQGFSEVESSVSLFYNYPEIQSVKLYYVWYYLDRWIYIILYDALLYFFNNIYMTKYIGSCYTLLILCLIVLRLILQTCLVLSDPCSGDLWVKCLNIGGNLWSASKCDITIHIPKQCDITISCAHYI